MDAHVIYQDNHIVVAYKPYGVLSEVHDTTPNMPAILREMTGGDTYTVHRLDKTTEGLIVYAKTAEAAAKLSAMIQNGELKKTYLAVVEGVPEDSGEMTDLLYFDRRKNKSYTVKRERKGVKQAKLRYERLATKEISGNTVSTVKIRLLTGRTHQIRVQFASRRMPLVGDRRYGSHLPAEHIALCAAELEFRHPVTEEPMRFTYPPGDKVFES